MRPLTFGGETVLKTKHLFPFIRMIKALDIKNEIKEIAQLMKQYDNDTSKLDEEKGLDFFFLFIEKLPNAENEVMDFLAVFTEKKRKEIEDMPVEELWGILKEVVTDPNFRVFFQQALK